MAEYSGSSSSGNKGMVPTLRDLSLLYVPNWYLLGLQLGVSGDELDMIERNYPRDNDLCKVKMFGAWLRVDTSATYGKLARALVTVGKRNIAEAMCTAQGIPLTVLDDVPAATAMDYLPPTPKLPQDLPECVTVYVREEPQVLETSSSNSTEKMGSQKLGPSSMSNPATVVSAAATQTPFRNQEDSSTSKSMSDDMSTSEGVKEPSSSTHSEETQRPLEAASSTPGSTSSPFPYLKESGLTPEQQEGLSIRLCVESEDIVHKFWHLHSTVYESLRQRNVPVDRLVVHLLSLGAFDPVTKDSQKPVLQTFQQLQKADSIEDVLLAIKDYFSFFNYHVIEHIVDKLGTEHDKIELQNYKKAFDEYSKRRIYECPPVYGPMSNDDHTDLVLKLDSVYEKFTVKELKKFEYRLSRIFCVAPQSVLRLCRVDEGCLQLIFQVPSFVQQEIFPLSSEQESALAAERVIRLTCGDYQFAAKGDENGSEPEDTESVAELRDPVFQAVLTTHDIDTDSARGSSIITDCSSFITDCSSLYRFSDDEEDPLSKELDELDEESTLQISSGHQLTGSTPDLHLAARRGDRKHKTDIYLPRKARQASSITRRKKHAVDQLVTPSDSRLNVYKTNMEFRVGSAPVKSLNIFNTPEEIAQSGYLNRKCLQDVGGKRSKDRSWQCVWCQLRGKTLEFYRVEGVQAKRNGDPPPRDVYPPPNIMKVKIGFVNLEGGVVELDYTSQLNKDIHKRREKLFRLQLSNAMEFLLQAPSDKQASNWVTSLESAAQGSDGFEHVSPQHQIRAARSINKRSRQNVHSVKVSRYHAPAYDEPDHIDSPEVSLHGDLRLQLLRKRLQSKRELLRLLEKMYSCFVIGNGSMYCDMPMPQSPEVIVDRRLSPPDQIVLTQNGCRNSGCHDDSDDCRSNTGKMAVPILHQEEELGDGIVTELLTDYYLVPGAAWSLLKSGERVRVVARMSGGWYRCIALRDANCQLDPDPSNTSLVSAVSTSGLSEMSASSEQQLSEVQPLQEDLEEEGREEEGREEEGGEREEKEEEDREELVFQAEETVQLSSTMPLRAQKRRSSFERPLGYQMATEDDKDFENYLSVLGTSSPSISIPPSHTRTRSHPAAMTASLEMPKASHLAHHASMPLSLQPDAPLNPKQARLSGLLESELLNRSYSIPLVGCVPLSALKAFAKRDSAPSPSAKKDPHPISNEKAPLSSLLSRSLWSTPLRKPQPPSPSSSSPHHPSPSSPSSSPLHKGNKPQEPANIRSLFDSGGGGSSSFFKRLFAKRKSNSKMQQEDGAVHPSSSSLPPTPPHPLLDDNFDPIGQVHVSSISGRSIRSTGVGLVIGEDSSSQEEEGEEDGASTVSPSSSFQESLTLQDTPKPALPEQDSFELKSSNQPLKQAAKNATSRTRKHKTDIISPRKGRQASSITRRKKHAVDQLVTPSDSRLNVTDIFRQPPQEVKRFIYLDPSNRKHGFRLESYRGCTSHHDKVLRTFVPSVAPGSPAFMAGLFPGDTILEVNGERVKYAPVEKVVEAITRVPSDSSEMIQLVVEFVDGVTRLELMKKADELKFEMRAKQTRLRVLTQTENRHLSNTITLPTPHSLTPARTLPPWGDTFPSDNPGPHPLPFNRQFNSIVSLYIGSVTQLLSNALVIPLMSIKPDATGKENILYQLLKAGGRELLDELCLSKQCRLGENIVTQGHNLPTTRIFHCVFGDLQESLLSCCRGALDTAVQEKDKTIVFWLDGFIAVSISPHVVVETVRLWLQEDLNSQKFERIVFCTQDNPPLLEASLEKYFPLLPFATCVSPEGVEGKPPSADELLGEVPNEKMEGKTANQSEPEGEIPNEKVEGETPGGDGAEEGEVPDDIAEEKVELPSDKEMEWQTLVAKGTSSAAIVVSANKMSEVIVPPHKTEDGYTPTVRVTESPEEKEPVAIATKPAAQETIATKLVLQETVATKPVLQETVAAKPVLQETVPTKPAVQEIVPTKSMVQETVATKPVIQEVIDLDAITLELDNLQKAAQESLAELTVSKTSRDLDTLEKAAQDKLAELGGSKAKEELDPLDQVVQQLMPEAARLSPAPSEPTKLSPAPKFFTTLSLIPPSSTSSLGMKRSPSDSLLPNPERTESDL